MRRLLIASILVGSVAIASAEEPREVTTHYYASTLTVDALSMGMLVGAWAAEGPHGEDSDTSVVLAEAGLLGGLFGSPIVHIAREHVDRGMKSVLLRGGLASVGMWVAIETATCSEDTLLCGFDRIGPGVLIGLTVASVIDAATQTEETHEVPTWVPQVAASSRGVQVGIAATF